QPRRGEAEVLDDLDVLPRGQLPDQDRRPDEQNGEEDEVVEDTVAHRLTEHRDRDASRGVHRPAPSDVVPTEFEEEPDPSDAAGRAPSPMSATRRTNTSSSVSRTGFSDTSVAPAAVSSRSSSSGRPSGGRSMT